MNALEGECFCLRKTSVNVNKLFAVLFLYVFRSFFCYTMFCCWLFTSESTVLYTDVATFLLFVIVGYRLGYYPEQR